MLIFAAIDMPVAIDPVIKGGIILEKLQSVILNKIRQVKIYSLLFVTDKYNIINSTATRAPINSKNID